MPQGAIVYQADDQTRHADTCEALVRGHTAGEVELVALARGAYPGARLGRNVLPGVRSVGFWDAAHDQSWGLDWHMNEGLELMFLETGRLAFATGERHHMLGADDLTITRPWQPHRVGAPDVTASRLHWLILDVGVRRPNESWKWPHWIVLTTEDRAELTNILRHNEQPVWHASAGLRRCVQRIAQSVVQTQAGESVSRLVVHLNELLVALLELFREQQVELDDRLSSTTRTVELFLTHLRRDSDALAYPWTANEMAEHCGLGLTRLCIIAASSPT